MPTAARQTKPRAPKVQPAQQEPEEFVIDETKAAKPGPPQPPDGMYPKGAELFAFTAKSTGVTYWLPMKFEEPSMKWVWGTYDKPFHIQSWEWMKQAKVPRPMQAMIVDLMDENPAEYLDLFNSWFEARGSLTPGE